MDNAEKVRENTLRRAVKRRGYVLQKRKRTDPKAWDYGTWQIVDPVTNTIVLQDFTVGQGYGASLEDVEEWLSGETPKPGQNS